MFGPHEGSLPTEPKKALGFLQKHTAEHTHTSGAYYLMHGRIEVIVFSIKILPHYEVGINTAHECLSIIPTENKNTRTHYILHIL